MSEPEMLPFEAFDFDPVCRLCGSDENTIDEDGVCLSAVCQALWSRETALQDAA